MEGNTYSLADTKKLLLEGKSPEDKLDSERVMILNHKDAISFLINNQNANISSESIRTLHYLLADGLVPVNLSGNFRNEPVKVSGSVYVPLDNYKKINETFEKIVNKALQINDPYEQSIFLLINLSYLQAFIDVNKRVARLACNIPLITNNLIPISFNDIDISDYRNAVIAIYEFNAVAPLIELYIWSYIRTAKEYAVTIESYGFDAIRVKYREQRRALISKIISENIHKKIDETINIFAKDKIPLQDQSKFILDVNNDLRNIDAAKIAGLGVTRDQFMKWMRLT